MAATIRQIGLTLLTAGLRLFIRRAPAGWSRSTRGNDLSGR